jgi:hypothetical protein
MLAGLRRKGSEGRQHRAERKEAKCAGRAGTRPRKKPEVRRQFDDDADAHSSGATASSELHAPSGEPEGDVILITRSYFE